MPVNVFAPFIDPSPSGSFGSIAWGVNDMDQMVGYYQDASSAFTYHSFLTNGLGDAITFINFNDPLGPTDTEAHGINNADQIVGYYFGATAEHGFLLSGGTYTNIDDPFATTGTFPHGINNAGHIVGSYNFNGGTGAFLETPIPGGSAFSNPAANIYSAQISANGVNDMDWVVGSYQDPTSLVPGVITTHGFLWKPNGEVDRDGLLLGIATTLDDPLAGPLGTVANGINDGGQIVGVYYDASNQMHGFLYSGGTYVTIDDPGFVGATFLDGINNNGQIVGSLLTHGMFFLETTLPNPPPMGGTTANMILVNGVGNYEVYNIGNNAILSANSLGQVGTDWKPVGLGGFNGTDTSDMLLRNSTTGGFEVYDIANNNIANAAPMGAVGLDWAVQGFGNFSSNPGETDMILRNSNSGGVEVYDIRNNQITGAASMGAVGVNWQFSGVGNFSGRGTSDMMLRNSNTGGLEVYDISNNQLTGAAFIGNVGVDWKFSGVGNFSGVPGETDLLLRSSTTGGLELYDLNNNQLTNAAFIGTVGLEWQFAGIAAANGASTSDLVLRNVNTGAFEVYDIANNQLTGAAALGAVGTDWSLGGFAADPPTASAGSIDGSSQVAQLTQAMAGFGGSGGAGESLNTAPLGSDTSQQPLLTTPQHA